MVLNVSGLVALKLLVTGDQDFIVAEAYFQGVAVKPTVVKIVKLNYIEIYCLNIHL